MPVFDIVELECCGTCRHFRRHYVRMGEVYSALQYGHCVYPRQKRRAAEDGCPRWAPGGPPEVEEEIYCLLYVRRDGENPGAPRGATRG